MDDELVGEGETPSYLQDATALPDFVDTAPLEASHVSYELSNQYLVRTEADFVQGDKRADRRSCPLIVGSDTQAASPCRTRGCMPPQRHEQAATVTVCDIVLITEARSHIGH